MIYLKIFHKNFLLILILIIAGCATDINSVVSAEVVDTKNSDTVFPESIQDKPEDIKSFSDISSNSEDDPIIDIGWTDPEPERNSPLLFLPVLPPEEKKSNKYEISELLYTFIFLDNDNFGWNEMYFFETEIEEKVISETNSNKSIESKPEEEQKSLTNSSNTAPRNEEISETIYSERSISASVLDKLDILLNGKGWIYLPDQENSDLEYIGRKFTNENTIYTFLPNKEKNYKLRFQYQDLTDNIITIEIINLSIINDQILQIISDLNDQTENEEIVIEEIFDFKSSVITMLEKGDSVSLSNLIPELLESNEADIQKMLPEIIELLYEHSFYISVSTILENLILDDSFDVYSDYYLYLLGKIYEQDSQIRNEIISAKYYKMLIDNYPASIYWNEAQDRYRYIKRRYIDIR